MIMLVNAQLHHWNGFKSLSTQAAVEKTSDVQYQPLTSLRDNTPVEIYIPASTVDYVDLNNTKLCVIF